MTNLPDDLEAATEGSRKDSDLVLLALGQDWDGVHPDKKPHPARSVDDGLALAGDDWVDVLDDALARYVYQRAGETFHLEQFKLYVCAALVRAKEQETASER